MSVVLDTNIIIYAIDGSDAVKSPIARRLLAHSLRAGWPIPRQVIGELLSVGHRRNGDVLGNARTVAALLEEAVEVVDTDAEATHGASALAERHRMQYLDAVICRVAESHGAALLLSEDMHGGLAIGSLTIINPFAATNRSRISALLTV